MKKEKSTSLEDTSSSDEEEQKKVVVEKKVENKTQKTRIRLKRRFLRRKKEVPQKSLRRNKRRSWLRARRVPLWKINLLTLLIHPMLILLTPPMM